jgi:flagellum-specific peptidoglycan hydrolase FlgJ
MQLEELSNISDNLAMMPDPALQKFAQLHRQDPYMVSLALSESNRRKKMRMAAQGQAGAMPQPKVADAAIAGMAQQQLPENQGIAQIPAPNMQAMADGGIAGYGDGDDVPRRNGMAQGGMYDFAQRSEPVVRMAEGGIAGYKKGGLTEKQEFAMQYKDVAEKVGKELGVDPGILISQWGLETAWGTKTVGQYNFGNIKDVTGKGPKAYDKMEKSRDSYKSYDSPEAFAADYTALIKRNFPKAVGAGSDIGAFSAGLQSGTKGAYATDPNYRKVLANTYKNLPMGAAVAEEVPGVKKPPAAAPVDTSTAAQIPGQTAQAPASNYDQTNSFFGRMADKLGIPLEAQRQIGTTLNAPTPLAPVVGSAKSGSGIVALGEKIGDKLGFLQGPKGRMSPQEIAALQKESGGLKALEASQQVTKEAQAAGATLDEQEYLRKMVEANRAKEAADKYSKSANIAEASMLREGQDVATAQRLSKTGQQAQATGRVDALADKALPTNNAAPAGGVAPGTIPFKGIDDAELQRMQEANQAPMTKDDIVKAAEEATPAKERKGFSNDDLLTLGLSLLASKSPNFMTALGEAGLATVAGKKEREKLERDQAMIDAELGYKKAKTKEAEAQASYIERGSREKKLELEAEKMIQNHMSDWMKSMEGKMGALGTEGPLAKQREEDRVRTAIYASLGITPIMRSQSAAPSGGGGFKFLGVQ